MAPLSPIVVHSAVTFFLTGLIWTIQLVHYPMFRFLDRGALSGAHEFHAARITFIVAPAMLLEAGLAAWVLAMRGGGDAAAVAGFALVAVIWVTTGLVMVPLHNRLAGPGPRAGLVESLVQWNWVRTFAWTGRAVLCLFWLQR